MAVIIQYPQYWGPKAGSRDSPGFWRFPSGRVVCCVLFKGGKNEKRVSGKNVYEACMERLHFIFEEFDNILVSFSGGKDSGLLLNLVLDYKKNIIRIRRSAYFIRISEAQYTVTTEYIERTLERIKDEAEIYWFACQWPPELP